MSSTHLAAHMLDGTKEVPKFDLKTCALSLKVILLDLGTVSNGDWLAEVQC